LRKRRSSRERGGEVEERAQGSGDRKLVSRIGLEADRMMEAEARAVAVPGLRRRDLH
jgi:hypothetical protein